MENSIWIDLGRIGHKSIELKELFRNTHLIDLPQEDVGASTQWVVFINYSIHGSRGTKVLTNAFFNESDFYKVLTEKMINEYVKTDKPLEFESDF